MLTTRWRGIAVLAAAWLLLVSGCRSGSTPLAAVQGKVTFRGEPLRGGTIVFTPDASRGTRGELAWAEIQQDGSYTLKTGEASGVAAGWHRVTVSSTLPPGPPAPGHLFSFPPSVLPTQYRDPRSSGLTCEVKPDRPNTINFQLD
jgi:hypothetical protein